MLSELVAEVDEEAASAGALPERLEECDEREGEAASFRAPSERCAEWHHLSPNNDRTLSTGEPIDGQPPPNPINS